MPDSDQNSAKEQLANIADRMKTISVIVVPLVIIFLINSLIGGDGCAYGEFAPFLAAAGVSVGLASIINPLFAIIVGILSGLILNFPWINNFLC